MTRAFRIAARCDPQTLPRIVGLFAQRSIIPAQMTARLSGGQLHVAVVFADVDGALAEILAAKLREAVLVESVRCLDGPVQASARASRSNLSAAA